MTDIENALVDDPARAYAILGELGTLLLSPEEDPLKPIRNFPRDTLIKFASRASSYGVKVEDITMPCEIGRFLMENLTFLPTGLEACKELIHHYEHRDLYGVMKAVNEAVVHKDSDVLTQKSEKLGEIFKLVWEDAGGAKTKVSIAKYLMTVGFGAVGMIAVPSVGIFGSLGFLIANKALEAGGDSLSEKVVRSITKGSTFAIYDFKKKYGLDRRPIE